MEERGEQEGKGKGERKGGEEEERGRGRGRGRGRMFICVLREPQKCPRETEWPLLVSFLSSSPVRGHDPPLFWCYKLHGHGFCLHMTVPPEHVTVVLLNSYLQGHQTHTNMYEIKFSLSLPPAR
jgi:hypothetical protein